MTLAAACHRHSLSVCHGQAESRTDSESRSHGHGHRLRLRPGFQVDFAPSSFKLLCEPESLESYPDRPTDSADRRTAARTVT
eukprot:3310408-Rhodomonas_salina.1